MEETKCGDRADVPHREGDGSARHGRLREEDRHLRHLHGDRRAGRVGARFHDADRALTVGGRTDGVVDIGPVFTIFTWSVPSAGGDPGRLLPSIAKSRSLRLVHDLEATSPPEPRPETLTFEPVIVTTDGAAASHGRFMTRSEHTMSGRSDLPRVASERSAPSIVTKPRLLAGGA